MVSNVNDSVLLIAEGRKYPTPEDSTSQLLLKKKAEEHVPYSVQNDDSVIQVESKTEVDVTSVKLTEPSPVIKEDPLIVDSESSENEELQDPDELVLAGKRFLKEKNFPDAIECFSDAVESKLHALSAENEECETHMDMGPYYLEYGDALLQKAEHSTELIKSSAPNSKIVSLATQKTATTSTINDAKADREEFPRDNGGESVTSEILPHKIPFEAPAESKSDTHEDDVPDEQLAWEVFELARLCFAKKLENLEKRGELAPTAQNHPPINTETVPEVDTNIQRTVEDASFVQLRLGDLLLAEEQIPLAIQEFQKALEIVDRYGLPYTSRTAPMVSLAQAQLFGGKAKDALISFQKALQLITDHLNGVGGAKLQFEKIEGFQQTAEDLKIQISEIEKHIEEGIYDETHPSQGCFEGSLKPGPARQTSSGSNENDSSTSLSSTSALPALNSRVPGREKTFLERTGAQDAVTTTGGFDAPRLGLTNGETAPVIDLGVISPSRKKRPQQDGHSNLISSNLATEAQGHLMVADVLKKRRILHSVPNTVTSSASASTQQ